MLFLAKIDNEMMKEQPHENKARDLRRMRMRAHAGRIEWKFRTAKELRSKRN
jgi:hypothetical protein